MDLVLISFSKHELQEMIRTSVSEIMVASASNLSTSQEKYLTVEEATAFLQFPKSTIYSYTSKRLIPHYKRGKRLVFKQSDLEKWLSENKKKTVSEIVDEVDTPRSKRGGRK